MVSKRRLMLSVNGPQVTAVPVGAPEASGIGTVKDVVRAAFRSGELARARSDTCTATISLSATGVDVGATEDEK